MAQKLIAAREKDLLDVLLVATGATVDAERLSGASKSATWRSPSGAARWSSSPRVDWRLAQLWAERTGEALSTDSLARALARSLLVGLAP